MAWPLHDLTVTTPDLVLQGMTETDALALAAVVPEDLEHDPRLAHASPAADVLQAYWRNAGLWQPTSWVLQLTVLQDGRPIGLQALEAEDFAVRRTVDSHSWLEPTQRGKGFGKQMRAAVLELAFAHLGAQWAITEAWSDNAASLGVSRSLGYVENGVDVQAGRRLKQRLRLAAEDWTCPFPVTVERLTPCFPLFGAGPL
jgi:RimJ/RimL family protein N-acetyltransferase